MPKNLSISPLRGGDGSGGRLRTGSWAHGLSYQLRKIIPVTYQNPFFEPTSSVNKKLINKNLIMKLITETYSRTGRSQIGLLTYLLELYFLQAL